MLRKYINSEIKIFDFSTLDSDQCLAEPYFYIQSETVGNCLILEYCEKQKVCDLIPFTTMLQGLSVPAEDASKVDEYRAIVLNNDPFYRYSGRTLGEIFDERDTKWITQCLEKMHNAFIRDKVEYLAKYYKLV